MKKVALGRSGILFSRLCFGTLTLSPLQKDMSVAEGAKLLLEAFARGITSLDTAELYANYPHIGSALREWTGEDIAISTKCYAYDEKTAQASWRAAVSGLRREYIDVFMLHEQESEHTLRGHEEALAFFQKKKEQGYVGALGISTHFVAGVKAACRHPWLDVVHPIFNQSGIGIADGDRRAMEEAVIECHRQGLGVLGMKPLGGGHLIGEREQALRYVLECPYLDSIAIGMQSIAEIEYNCAVFTGADPRPWEDSVDRQPRRLMVQDWCEGCGACVGRCKQGALSLVAGKASVKEEKCVLCGYCASVCPQFCLKVL